MRSSTEQVKERERERGGGNQSMVFAAKKKMFRKATASRFEELLLSSLCNAILKS